MLSAVNASAFVHVVMKGESLESIASMYDIPKAILIKANPGCDKMIYIGQRLEIPAVEEIPESQSGAKQQTLSGQESRSISVHQSGIPQRSKKETASYQEPVPHYKNGSTEIERNTVSHPFFAVAQYQMGDFRYTDISGSYGLGLVASSISHWGSFHVGANVNFSINAGFVDDWGCIIDLGPSARVDINNRIFVNVPVNAICNVKFPEGSTDTETAWGARVAPSIHAFISDRFGLFAGPQLSIGFSAGSDVSFGFQAGLSYAF